MLRELYQEIIIDHSRAPRNYGNISVPSHSHVGHNPLCGDKLVIDLMVADNVITDVRFEGTGCAISMASASLMTEAIKNKTVPFFLQMFADFHILVTTGAEQPDLGKLSILGGVSEFPIRVKCATLAWHTLKAALEQNPHAVSTE